MKQSAYDPCLFIWLRNESMLLIGITTDDLAIFRSKTQDGTDMLTELLHMLQEKWKITYQDPAKGIIGYEIQYNEDSSLSLKQRRTIEKIVEALWPHIAVEDRDTQIPYTSIPMKTTWNEEDQNDSPLIDITSFLEKLGLIIFILRTRFDCSYAISRLSSRTHKCTEKDMESLKHLAAYLYHTREIGLTFYTNDDINNTQKLRASAACDAAFLVYDDSKSHLAFGQKLGSHETKSGYFSAQSQKEKNSPSSSTPVAETRAVSEVTKDIIITRGIVKEITGIDLDAAVILEDSSSCIRGCSDFMKSSMSRKMRHERLLFHTLMWHIKNDIIQLKQTESEEQPMDLLTKPLANPLHWHHMPSIQGHSIELTEAKNKAIKQRKSLIYFCNTYAKDETIIKHIANYCYDNNNYQEFATDITTDTDNITLLQNTRINSDTTTKHVTFSKVLSTDMT